MIVRLREGFVLLTEASRVLLPSTFLKPAILHERNDVKLRGSRAVGAVLSNISRSILLQRLFTIHVYSNVSVVKVSDEL